MAADEFFSSFFFWKRQVHTFQGQREKNGKRRSCKWRENPINVCNKNDKRLFIKQEAEKVNIYHFGFYLVDLENISAHVARLSELV